MWIESTKNGNFKFVERYIDSMTGKQKKVSITLEKNTASTRKLALEELTRKIEESQYGTSKEEATLHYVIVQYLKYQEKTVKASTYKRNYFAMHSIEKILGKDILINKLTAAYVNTKFIDSKRAHSTLNEFLTRFRALMNWAYKNDYIDNISFLVKLEKFSDKSHKEKIKDKYLEPDEIVTLLEYMNTSMHWFYYTKFMILSGLRPGEAVALRTSDIDLYNRVIHVTKTYDSNNKVETLPKTQTSYRDVYIQDELLDLCKEINLYVKQQKILSGVRNDYFLINKNAERVNYMIYEKYLREASEKVLDHKITAHALRHTHASLLLAEGVQIDTISRRLGHDNSKVTREIYLHITEKLKKSDNDSIQNIKII